jgi:hypothetical protein
LKETTMDQRERPHHEHQASATPGPSDAPDGANLNAIRQTAAGMLAAADDAISRVLSGDSQAFNAAARQEGGQ